MSRGPTLHRFAALLGKELHALFAQPLLWIVGAFFLLLSGYYFYTDLVFFVTFGFGENIFENFFQLLFVDLRLVLLLTVPLLTMRQFAEERKLGTIELLFTYPLRDGEIYLAKFLACAAAIVVLVAGTGGALAYLYALQPFPVAAVLAGYGGLLLMALSFVACGLLLSSLTDNQVVAAMSTLGTLLLLWVLSWNEPSPDAGPVAWLARLSMFDHFEGFSRGVVETKDLVYFACLILFAAAASLQVLASRAWRGRRLVPTLVGLAGLLVALSFADALGERHNLAFDLTPQQRYTLSPHARRILERLPQDVEVVAFLRSGNPANAATLDLLDRIAAASPRVQHRVVDVNRNPAMARRYGVDAFGAVVVESGGKRRAFSQAREALLVGAMLELTRGEPAVIAFARGHGEGSPGERGQQGWSALATALADEGDEVREIEIARLEAENPSVLVVVGGRSAWSLEEIAALERWMRRGGRLLALLDPTTAPEISAWLGTLGVAPRGDVVLDPENRLHGGEGVSIEALPPPVAADLGGATAGAGARSISDSLDHGVLLSFARSLDVGDGALALLDSGPQSWGTPDLDRAERGFAIFDGSRDLRGPLSVAAARETAAAGGVRPMRVVVVGDADFASNGFIDFLSNRDFVLNAVSWLLGEEDLIALRTRGKEVGRQQLFMSAAQARRALLIAVVGLPSASALVAVAILLRRRVAR
jgi:ABC-2 type transport system permease protein